MRFTRVTFFTGVVCLLIAITASAGGWAVVTVNQFPEYAIVGKAFSGTFSVRQHGVSLLSDLKPVIRATAPGQSEIKVPAKPSGREGEYRFELTLPKPGNWSVAVDSMFINYLVRNKAEVESPHQGNAGYVVLPLSVVAPGSEPAAMTGLQRGERLFNAKGCNVCHNRSDVAARNTIGPDLGNLKLKPEYVKRLLADPAATLKVQKVEYGQMPNLNLNPEEVHALTEFLLPSSARPR